jgi:hypothetical protein
VAQGVRSDIQGTSLAGIHSLAPGNALKTRESPTSDDLGIGLYNYREPLLASILRVLTTVIASLLPLCSVILQYFAHSDNLRLILIVVASAVFALALALMTNARKIEVFAATST